MILIVFLNCKNLNFKYYRSQENYILKNLNLEIKEGEHIGVVGRNGSGKTTLVKLFLNLYPDYEGLIQYGNTDMQRINTATLRKKYSYFHRKFMFSMEPLKRIFYMGIWMQA